MQCFPLEIYMHMVGGRQRWKKGELGTGMGYRCYSCEPTSALYAAGWEPSRSLGLLFDTLMMQKSHSPPPHLSGKLLKRLKIQGPNENDYC